MPTFAQTKLSPDGSGGLPLFNDKTPPGPSQSYRRPQRLFHGVAFVLLALLLSTGYWQYGRWHPCAHSPPKTVTAGVGLPKEIQQAWAAYSPYIPAAEYVAPPARCEIVQVNLLQRHGTRFPTEDNSKLIQGPLKKLKRAQTYSKKKYEFLREYEWDLGTDDLLPLGAKEAFDAGSEHYLRYKHLVGDDRLPFIRASDSERVILSTANWTEGFFEASGNAYLPTISVIIPEEKGANNTLDNSQCPNAKRKKKAAKAWRNKFAPPIVERINKAVPGARFNKKDVVDLMPLCAFETLYHGTASPFCGLFTEEEWQAREYYEDLTRYYKTGYGNPLGPVQGVGYVNELLARLTGEPVRDGTQTNRTLDGSPETFPLDRDFYVDFSHDNHMVAIYSAIGLFRPDEPPPTDRVDEARTFRISRMTPFSGRLITEKLQCDSGGKATGEKEEYVRMLVNDALQPLEFCGADGDGLCTLSAFVESQSYARTDGDGDWAKCFS